MKQWLKAFGTLLAGLTVGASAQAVYLIDTGVGSADEPGWTLASGVQWVAVEFFLPTASLITDIQARVGGDEGPVTLAIYSDGGEVPGIERFSTVFNADRQVAWYGPSQLGWQLDAGQHWLAFELRAGQDFNGFIEALAANPLPNGAMVGGAVIDDGQYHPYDNLHIAVRISGLAAPVPEPATAASLALGLVVILALRRRRV